MLILLGGTTMGIDFAVEQASTWPSLGRVSKFYNMQCCI